MDGQGLLKDEVIETKEKSIQENYRRVSTPGNKQGAKECS